jgi:hypothetical protein
VVGELFWRRLVVVLTIFSRSRLERFPASTLTDESDDWPVSQSR